MLDPSDHLLDLACGNGVITHRLASEVKSVVGVDFSQPYIDNARRYKSLPNVEYICGDVCDLRTTLAPVQKRFSKVLMHSALAYFSLDQFAALLVDLDAHLTQDARIYIAAVPDSGKRWRFYNTWRRAAVYVWNSLRGKESGIGKWWRKKELIGACKRLGFECAFLEPHPTLHVSHYRFDMLITRSANALRHLQRDPAKPAANPICTS